MQVLRKLSHRAALRGSRIKQGESMVTIKELDRERSIDNITKSTISNERKTGQRMNERNCDKCRHLVQRKGLIYSCEKWECEFEPKNTKLVTNDDVRKKEEGEK